MLRRFLALAAIFILPSAAAAADYKIVDRIKVPDGGFDYATYDGASGRVYMPRGAFTTVIDTRTGAVSQLTSAVGGHIALPVPGTSLLVVTNSGGTILVVDSKTDEVVSKLAGGKNPNSAVYDAVTKDVYVLNQNDGTATIVDPRKGVVVATISISPNTLEFPATDGKGMVFDNIETTGEIVAIDVKTRKVIKTFKLKGCEGPTGLAYDATANLLISACHNGVAKVVRAKDGVEVASLPIGRGPDAVIYDPVRKMAFVPAGQDGVLDVISLQNPAKISVVQRVTTAQGSRTGTVDTATGKVYLMSSKPDASKPAVNGRVPRLAGTSEVLVVGP